MGSGGWGGGGGGGGGLVVIANAISPKDYGVAQKGSIWGTLLAPFVLTEHTLVMQATPF